MISDNSETFFGNKQFRDIGEYIYLEIKFQELSEFFFAFFHLYLNGISILGFFFPLLTDDTV